jgi:hypothetical protein
MARKLYNIFVLRCVTCKNREERECKTVTEQPFCDRCYSPMVTESVILNSRKPPMASEKGS